MNLLDDFIIKKYIKIVLNTYHREAVITSEKCNIRCNICGDSNKSKFKKRGWFLDYKGKYRFKCFNCGISVLATTWLKKYYPQYYSQYIQELLLINGDSDKPKSVVTKKKPRSEKKDLKYFISINSDNDLSKSALEVCTSRNIPNNKYKNWYVATDGRYKNRLIIPIYDKKNQIAYWQGRALENQDPKYLNCFRSCDDAILAQLETVNLSQPIIIVEGYIDSLFIENSVATMSTNWSQDIQEKLDNLNCYYLIDYDKDNKQVQKRQIRLLKQNKDVFNWYKYLKDHNLEAREKWDINDLYSHYNNKLLFTFNDFKKWFTNDYLDKIYFN